MYKLYLLFIFIFSIGIQSEALADAADWWDVSGHLKLQSTFTLFPDDSIFSTVLDSHALDNFAESRIKLSTQNERWDFKADYQFIAIYSDTLKLASSLPGSALPLSKVINDDRRWWNLTYAFGNEENSAIVHRLDRLNLGFTTDNSVWRFGRQAISWGNGMIYNPVDVFNPFDPSAVDKEYKSGDDMLYGQYLFDSGNDVQAVAIVRRNPVSGDLESEQSSLAFKYHGFAGMNEFDLLAAEHYGDLLLGLGGNLNLGGAVLRGDLTWTDTGHGNIMSAVSSISYSWTWGGKNVSGVLEYYYSGFGQKNSQYAPLDLLQNPELLQRIERGELYTLARHYLGASAMIEVSPLLMLTPNLFINLEDPSALAQLVVRYDWKQNLMVLAALNLPVGSDGTEYGGIESAFEDRYYSYGPGFFAQLAWYF